MRIYTLLILGFLLFSCSESQKQEVTKPIVASTDFYDLDEIQMSGEIIMLTLYGPDTYYDFRGKQMGLQFQICQEFATSIGARIRVEIAADEKDLLEQLNKGEADLIAYNLPFNPQSQDYIWCGDSLETRKSSWVVRKNSPDLAEAVSEWFNTHADKVHELATWRERQRMLMKARAHINHRASIKNASKGIISDYDGLFKRYSRSLSWDWRLLAAQAYQESGFDPTATSWVGAQGLMQFMPGTARELGMDVNRLTDPETSISGAVRYLRMLGQKFQDVTNPNERIKFMLAAYNCGTLHVKDAQALAQKYGKNPLLWTGNVEEYILHLQEPKYYRDTSVKNGYCRGSETYNYVRQIMERYSVYRQRVR